MDIGFGVRVPRTLDYATVNWNPRAEDHNARPSRTDGQTDEHRGNSATIRYTNASRAKNPTWQVYSIHSLRLCYLVFSSFFSFVVLSTTATKSLLVSNLNTVLKLKFSEDHKKRWVNLNPSVNCSRVMEAKPKASSGRLELQRGNSFNQAQY